MCTNFPQYTFSLAKVYLLIDNHISSQYAVYWFSTCPNSGLNSKLFLIEICGADEFWVTFWMKHRFFSIIRRCSLFFLVPLTDEKCLTAIKETRLETDKQCGWKLRRRRIKRKKNGWEICLETGTNARPANRSATEKQHRASSSSTSFE